MRSRRAPRSPGARARTGAASRRARASARRAGLPRSAPSSSRAVRSATADAPSARATGPAARRRRERTPLQVAAERLFSFDRLEQRLEVAVAEAARAVPLDHLEEDGGPVLRGLREDLQEIAVLVAVDEDPVLLQYRVVLVDLADPVGDLLVIRVGRVEEDRAALLERLDRADDVRRRECDVLRACAVVELDVLLDLALALAFGGLVDRELDLPLTVRHHLRHESRVL